MFWKVLLLLLVPVLVMLMVLLPEPTPIRVPAVAVTLVPTRLTFLTVLVVALVGVAEVWSHTTAEDVPVLVLVMVKLREEVPALEPSIVTKLAPLTMMMAVVLEPLIDGVTAVFGLIVSVLVALPPFRELIVIGKVSLPE